MSQPPARRDASDVDAIAATTAYRELIDRLRRRIRESQARATRTLNVELLMLYWSIGRDILAQQQASQWGDGVVGRIADDLSASTGSARGFSRRNLFYTRRFAALWPDVEKVPSVMAQIGWTAHRVLLDAFADDPAIYAWYAAKAAESRWPVRHLKGQIDLRLHERQGAALTNFPHALEAVDAGRALEGDQGPVHLRLPGAHRGRPRTPARAGADRRHPEAPAGARHRLCLLRAPEGAAGGGREFFLDLLFYHHALRRFVIVDLKIGEFQPEFVSKMNLYLNAVDEQLRLGDDRESVGIILCTSRNETVAKLALHRVYAPIAVSTWRAGTPVPELPSVEVTDDVPADLDELAELDAVRTRLIDRVAQRAPQIIDGDAPQHTDHPHDPA